MRMAGPCSRRVRPVGTPLLRLGRMRPPRSSQSAQTVCLARSATATEVSRSLSLSRSSDLGVAKRLLHARPADSAFYPGVSVDHVRRKTPGQF